MTARKQQAIHTALLGDWTMAIEINEELLEENPEDIETLNRLAFAFSATGNMKRAKWAYEKVLKIDIFNPIAIKNLKRLNSNMDHKASQTPQIVNTMFIEESGKTKVISLINTAPPKIIRGLQVGQILKLCIKRSKLFVLNNENEYIGMLPDNIGSRLIKFMGLGNTYQVSTKAVEGNNVTIFIKELKRVPKLKDQPSFISSEKISLIFRKDN